MLSDSWQDIAVDLEIMQTEGFAAVKQVDPNMVLKKKQNNQVQEVQEGWIGHIMPFELVQKAYLSDSLQSLEQKENRFSEISSTYEEIIESFSEEEKDSAILDDTNTKFVSETKMTKELEEIYADEGPKEIRTLRGYLALFANKAKNPEKEAYVKEHTEIPWEKIAAKQNSVPTKAAVKNYISELQSTIKFPEDSYEGKIARVCDLMAEEKTLKDKIKAESASLHLDTKAKIESLSDSEAKSLLEQKWIHPLLNKLKQLPDGLINELASKVQKLADKYASTYADIASDIQATEQSLAAMLDELTGSESDQQALAELKVLLSNNGAKQ